MPVHLVPFCFRHHTPFHVTLSTYNNIIDNSTIKNVSKTDETYLRINFVTPTQIMAKAEVCIFIYTIVTRRDLCYVLSA